ncbi:FAD-dependent monooxygenase [Cognatiyoonia sp.]|uniref:FAD-dependent monooxygenase n=1 Tax=Cognatiyoonia sp. TaxID=2211652 RepID=UPI003F6A3340
MRKSIATTDLTDTTVGIVGGGIGGLTAALAFADRGATVCVFEQAPEFTEVGAGIQITPNAGRVLDALGLLQQLSVLGVVSEAVVPVDGLTGKPITAFGLTKQSPSYHFVHRAKLIDLLAGACGKRGVVLRTDTRVLSATPDGQVTFESDLSAGGSQATDFDLVVFADGIHSIGRILLNGASEPFFTGQVAWRAIVPGNMEPCAQIAMGPGKHIVTYPLGSDQINVVAVQERSDWAEEGWSHPDDLANLQSAFSDFAPSIRELLGRAEQSHLWGLFRHELVERWQSGRLAILGDAAHPTLPFLAQGANLAIEDAYVLARTVGELGVAEGLLTFQATRVPRVKRAIAAANANAVNYHLSGSRRVVSQMALKGIGRVAPDAFLKRLSWLYDHDVTA